MALPKNYQWRKGDLVRVHGVVEHDRQEIGFKLCVELMGTDGPSVFLNPDYLDIVQQKIVVGDNVAMGDDRYGHVVAVHGEFAWVDEWALGHPAPATIHVNALERVETQSEEPLTGEIIHVGSPLEPDSKTK